MGNIDYSVRRMIYWCEEVSLGYSQGSNRWDIRPGGSADCSSLVITVLREGGFATGSASWTGNMSSELRARGWVRVPVSQRGYGDVLLKPGHTALHLGGGKIGEAAINEFGGILGGRPGDQTGRETRVTGDYGGWTEVLRWPGPRSGTGAASSSARSVRYLTKGVDISDHQRGLQVGYIGSDFTIVKATEGLSYRNPQMASQANDAIGASNALGFYHFARPGDMIAQADFFVRSVGSYLSKATLWLDWEDNAVPLGPGAAATFLNRVRELTGQTPGIYMNGAGIRSGSWQAIASSGVPLWYAGGPSYDSRVGWSTPSLPSVAYWGSPLIYQYTQYGRVSGYNGNLDLNYAPNLTLTAWNKMRGKNDGLIGEVDMYLMKNSAGTISLVSGTYVTKLTPAAYEAHKRSGMPMVNVSDTEEAEVRKCALAAAGESNARGHRPLGYLVVREKDQTVYLWDGAAFWLQLNQHHVINMENLFNYSLRRMDEPSFLRVQDVAKRAQAQYGAAPVEAAKQAILKALNSSKVEETLARLPKDVADEVRKVIGEALPAPTPDLPPLAGPDEPGVAAAAETAEAAAAAAAGIG